jgi:hypothetical protein
MAAIGMATALLTSCASRPVPPPAPVPAASRVQVPEIVIPIPEPPPFEDWRDRPLTPGDWTYAAVSGGTEARFGPEGEAARLTVRCDTARRQIVLAREVAAAVLEVQTTFGLHVLPTATGLAPGDPLLDEMAFSRGRFLVRTPGQSSLIVPAWAEVSRVVEDCRG